MTLKMRKIELVPFNFVQNLIMHVSFQDIQIPSLNKMLSQTVELNGGLRANVSCLHIY